jgi:C1A family cysteine protease
MGSIDIQKIIKKAKKAGWIAGKTDISDKSENDFSLMCGLQLDKEVNKSNILGSFWGFFKNKKKLPKYYNWRDQKKVTKIKSQDSCGICAAEALTAGMESQLLISQEKKYKNEEPDLSESHLFFCSGHNCSSGSNFLSLLNFANNQGVTKEEYFPFEKETFNKCILKDGWDDNLTFVKNWDQFRRNEKIKQILIEQGPVVAGMDVYADFKMYKGGIYHHVYGIKLGGHGVLIIGFGEEKKVHFWSPKIKYWIVKNSWGENWGESGFFRIRFDDCGIGKKYPVYSLAVA